MVRRSACRIPWCQRKFANLEISNISRLTLLFSSMFREHSNMAYDDGKKNGQIDKRVLAALKRLDDTNARECPRVCCLSLSASAHRPRAPFIYPRRLPHGRDQDEVSGEATDWNRAAVEALRPVNKKRFSKTKTTSLIAELCIVERKRRFLLATEALETGNKDVKRSISRFSHCWQPRRSVARTCVNTSSACTN